MSNKQISHKFKRTNILNYFKQSWLIKIVVADECIKDFISILKQFREANCFKCKYTKRERVHLSHTAYERSLQLLPAMLKNKKNKYSIQID